MYTLTTAAFSFLPIVSVYANPKTLVASCDAGTQFYTCSDGKYHTLANKTYHLPNASKDDLISAIYVGKQGTVVDASQITFTGDNPEQSATYAVSVEDGGYLLLKDSHFKNVSSLRAKNGTIEMFHGTIKGSSRTIYAEGERGLVKLASVRIEPGDSDVKDISIFSSNGARVEMASSIVYFEEGGFESQLGGSLAFLSLTVNGTGKKHSYLTADGKSVNKLSEAFEVSQGGDVYFSSSALQLTDMHGFLIENFTSFGDDNGKLLQEYNSSNAFKKTNIRINESNITIQGEESYGLYLNSVGPREFSKWLNVSDEKLSKARGIIKGTASVSLSKTTLTVPDGIAIYSTGSDLYGAEATLELSEGTRISGDVLLKAENNSSIIIKASETTFVGGIRVEDSSTVRLQLTRGSAWYLKKSKKSSQEDNSTDSFLSSVSLKDSTLIFSHYMSPGYQTLRIGTTTNIFEKDRYGVGEAVFSGSDYKQPVYSAEGNSRIQLSAFLNDDGSFDTQKTDRVLIYGDVSGTTLIQMEDFPRVPEKKVKNVKDSSVSIIQVSGTATEASFKLMDRYATINGFPYQYHLRGYGPNSSLGKADSKNRLVAGEGDFWDFRLESIYINPETDSSETETTKPVSTDLISIPSSPTQPSSSGETPVPIPDVPSVPSSIEPSAPSPSDNSIESSTVPELPVPLTPVEPSPSESSVPSSSEDPTLEPSTPSPDTPSEPVDSHSTDPTSTPSIPVSPPPSPVAPVPMAPVPSSSEDPTLEPSTPSPDTPSEPVDSHSTDRTPTPSTPVSPSPSPVAPSSSETSVPSASEGPTPEPSTPSPDTPSEPVDSHSTDRTLTPSTPVSPSPSPVAPSSSETSVPSASEDPTSEPSTPSPDTPSEPVDSHSTDPTPTPSTPVSPPPSPVAPSSSETSVPSASEDPTPEPSTPSPDIPSEPVDSHSTDLTPTPSTPVSPPPSPVAPVPVKPDIQTEPKIRAVVPQLPTYLLLPNALFHAGFMDLTTQNKKLETIRNSSVSSLKSHENSAFFVRGYGGSYHYASNLSAFEYGYGAELDYSAFEAGVLLKKTDRTNSRAFFGIMGTYGSLSLHPLNVEQSKKSTFDRWSVSAYGSLQDDTGFYVDGLLSHGLFKGDVFTLARDKVATLKGKQSNASLTSGQRFAIGHTGFIFDPQFQLIYQRLQFDHVRDVDNLDVDLGKFNQWTARVGGRLTKILTPSEKERIVSFYGKLYFSRNFGDRHFVSFKNDFQLGAFGSSLEAGVGFNAQLSAKFVLHGDVNYQHRLTKAGFSGASFSAGFRYLF